MNTLVQTPFGALQGLEEKDCLCFRGVPFAKPPVGELRFRKAQPPEPWKGVRMATEFARDPVQANLTWDVSHYSEDCLYLNLWIPKNAEGPLPVMVWVPGGAYANGGAGTPAPNTAPLYDGTRIARDGQCIFVSISYRLNAYGFLNLSRYSDRFDDDLGMRDIIAALKWVKKCIASFGGDPDNVTLAGESAGGGAIAALLLCDEATPYFHKSIIESNCWGSYYTVEEEDEICRKFYEFAGIPFDRPESILEISHQKVLEAGVKLDGYALEHFLLRCSYCPVVDGKFVKDFPTLSALEGADKPLLVGYNLREADFQVWAYLWKDEQVPMLADRVVDRMSPEDQKRILALYDLSSRRGLMDLLSETMYTVPSIWFAEHYSRKAPTYLYRFDYTNKAQAGFGLRCCHMSELFALFPVTGGTIGVLGAGDEENLEAIGLRLRKYWGAFARTGDPNAAGLTEWKPFDEKDRYNIVFDLADHLEQDSDKVARENYLGLTKLLI